MIVSSTPTKRRTSGPTADRRGEAMVEDRASQVTVPMTGRSRGTVVFFPLRRPGTRRRTGRAAAVKKPAPGVVLLRERRDAALNAHWDHFMTLVVEAWCWRDPDCFAALEQSLAHLRRTVDRDWS
jgi:hypothetical protein